MLSNTLDITVFITNVAVGGYILRAISRAIERATKTQSVWIIFGVAVVVIIVLLVLGVLVPKRVGMKYPEKTLYRLLSPAGLLMGLLTPVAFIVSKLSNLVLRIIGINPHEQLENVTEEEIITMVNEGQEKGVLEEGEAKMINNIFEFGDKEAHDVMVHRSNIIGIDQNTKTLQLLSQKQEGVEVILFTENAHGKRGFLATAVVNDFIKQYPPLRIKPNPDCHDRWIVLDYGLPTEAVYHCGASSKDAGKKVCAINKVASSKMIHPVIDALLLLPDKSI